MMVYPPHRGTTLDPAAWLALAEEFDRRDRIYGTAAGCRRLAIFRQILTEEEGQEAIGLPKVVSPEDL